MKNLIKKLKFVLTICVVVTSALFVLTACGSSLPAPDNVRITDEMQITWFRVEGARSYDVSILCKQLTFTHPVSDDEKAEYEKTVGVENIESTRYNTISIEDLPEGDYEFKVRAVPSGKKEPSGWSPTITYHKDYTTGCKYQLISGGTEYAVQSYGQAKGEIFIEDNYKGKPVTQIGKEAFKNAQRITAVHIGSNVKSIGEAAFLNCKNLITVTMPDNLKSIGQQAFQGCAALTEISIPDSVITIPAYAFRNCKELKTVDIGSNVEVIGVEAFKGCNLIEAIELPKTLTTIDESAFYQCRNIKSYDIPANVSSIGASAFYDNQALENVTIAEGSRLRSIPSGLFSNCRMLKSITLQEGLVSIGSQSFQGCKEFEKINIPSTVRYIGANAFDGTKIISESTEDIIYIDDWVITASEDAKVDDLEDPNDPVLTKIDDTVLKVGTKGIACAAFFGATGIRTVRLPNSIEYLNSSAFSNCTSLYMFSTSAGSKLQTISSNAFSGCSITSLRLSSEGSLTSIEDYAFSGNMGLDNNTLGTSIIPRTVTHIGAHVFYGTALYNNALAANGGSGVVYAGNWVVGHDKEAGLTSVTLKADTVGICDYAFQLCGDLTEVIGMRYAKYIGTGAFYQCGALGTATFNLSLNEIQPYTFYECKSLYNVDFPEDLEVIGRSAFYRCFSLNELDLSQTKVTYISPYSFYSCSNIKDIKLNTEVTDIDDYAFYGCSGLTELTIPRHIQTLGYRAFEKCEGLTSVTIEMPLTKLPDRMFYGSVNLTSVTLPDTLTSIGNYAFYNCAKLEKINLGENIASIGDYAFYNNTNLHDIYMPENLTSIGRYAFKGALNLRSIYLSNKLTYIGQYAFYGADNLTIFVENDAKTSDWHLRWNSKFRPVIYNSALAKDKSYLESLIVAEVENIKNLRENETLSKPQRAGYKFVGFATTQGGTPTYQMADLETLEQGTVLYACYEEGEEEFVLIVPEPIKKPADSTDNSSSSSGEAGVSGSDNPQTSLE